MSYALYDSHKPASSLIEVRTRLIDYLSILKNHSSQHAVGFVSGSLTADGPQYILENKRKLQQYARKLSEQYSMPLICCCDIMSGELYKSLEEKGYVYNDFVAFWRNILGSGQITHIFMTPRWQYSRGARDEYRTAQEYNLSIHFVQ